MITRTFGKDFTSSGGALTLSQSEVTEGDNYGEQTRTHDDGWTITGRVCEDYYVWVNDFEATHPTLGWVKGNFETTVTASSKKAFDDFYKKHTPEAWDYGDI